MNPSTPNQAYPGGVDPTNGQPIPQTGQYGSLPDTSAPVATQQPQPPYGFNNSPPPSPSPPQMPQVSSPQTAATPLSKANPNSTQNTLQIAEIRDGIVIMNDGSFRAVVMAKAINFDLMSQSEQESVEYSYQSFLNSLYFPIQIFIHSQRIDLRSYIEKLDRLRSEHDNMLLAMLIDDYVSYIDALSQQANIMDKEFYVIIPFYPHVDVQKALTQSKNFFSGLAGLFNQKENHVIINEIDLENAKSELRNRVQAVLSGLLQTSVQGLPLDTQELIELYYDVYNPDTATYQQLKNFDSLGADVIRKGNGQAPQTHLQGELPQ